MKRLLLVPAVVAAALVLFAVPAMADSPHYVKAPTATVSGNSLTVSWKAAGLGSVTTANFTLSGNVTVTSQCFTKSGNPVNGVPKTETVAVNVTQQFPVRNGQTTGSITVTPLSTLQCTGNQHVVILSVSCNGLTLNSDVPGLPSEPVTC